MTQIKIKCDRCGQTVDGFDNTLPVPGLPQKYTIGFYNVKVGCWTEFARENESNVCDACMHADPKYKSRYWS